MKKILKGLLCAGLGGLLALSAAGCNTKKGVESEHRNSETDTLRLAIGSVEEKFNPMFYTSQNDGEIVALTQAGLVTTEASKDGKRALLAYGENHPTVALDYKESYYRADKTLITTGNGREDVVGDIDNNGYTEYEFLIKNGMKFSDGVPLTVMDVLFNLYVYLDPIYSGSSTIYSTKIDGMQAYRKQDLTASENEQLDMTKYYAIGRERVNALINWSKNGGTLSAAQNEDLAKVKDLYREELTTDWSSIETSWEEGYKNYDLDAAWKVFYYIEGMVKKQTTQDTSTGGTYVEVKDDDGKFLTELSPNKYNPNQGEVVKQNLIDDMNSYVNANLADYMSKNNNMTAEQATLALQKEKAIQHVYDANTIDIQIKYILQFCGTGTTAVEAFAKDALAKENSGKEKTVKNIRGITVSKTKEFNGKTYLEDHDVLKIKVVGIDPKAKWNFGITVAPMHYYSSKELTDKAMAAYSSGKVYGEDCEDFGVAYSETNFFDKTLNDPDKNHMPVGAGPYKCNGNAKTFYDGTLAKYVRNENFETMGAGIENAKIKYVTYKVTQDSQIVSSLKAGELDYAEPIATSDNQTAVREKANLEQGRYMTGGYGYVGINPKYVPEIAVRKAIMMSFNTAAMVEYYGQSLVNIIDRPMSMTSWAYPDGASRYYAQEADPAAVKRYILDNCGNRVYEGEDKRLYDDNGPLTYTFTIAGETTDHPATDMFIDAQNFLKDVGITVSVETNIRALTLLVTGDLAVWAAAWSSSIDPDPYQNYSIYSNASGTKNWYKDGIREAGPNGKYKTEYAISSQINEKIVAGRSTLSEANRIRIYEECLDLIMDLAVEFPTYQRYNLFVYNAAALDKKTMHVADANFIMGPIAELWKVDYRA